MSAAALRSAALRMLGQLEQSALAAKRARELAERVTGPNATGLRAVVLASTLAGAVGLNDIHGATEQIGAAIDAATTASDQVRASEALLRRVQLHFLLGKEGQAQDDLALAEKTLADSSVKWLPSWINRWNVEVAIVTGSNLAQVQKWFFLSWGDCWLHKEAFQLKLLVKLLHDLRSRQGIDLTGDHRLGGQLQALHCVELGEYPTRCPRGPHSGAWSTVACLLEHWRNIRLGATLCRLKGTKD